MKIRFSSLALILALAAPAALAAKAPNVTGAWKGSMTAGPAHFQLALHISETAAGALKATMKATLAGQGTHVVPITSVALKGSNFSFAAAPIHWSYKGTVSADGKSINGTMTQVAPGQGTANLPVDFSRAGTSAKK